MIEFVPASLFVLLALVTLFASAFVVALVIKAIIKSVRS